MFNHLVCRVFDLLNQKVQRYKVSETQRTSVRVDRLLVFATVILTTIWMISSVSAEPAEPEATTTVQGGEEQVQTERLNKTHRADSSENRSAMDMPSEAASTQKNASPLPASNQSKSSTSGSVSQKKKPVRKSIKSSRRLTEQKRKRKKRKRKFPKNRPKRALKPPPPLGRIPFPLGEQLTFKVNMLNAHSGTVVLKVGRRGKYRDYPVVELSGFIRSSPFLENFYPIRDSLSVLVDERTFTPLKSEFYLQEKERKIEYFSEFFSQTQQIKWKKKRYIKGKERLSQLTYATPESIYNVLSSLYALRRVSLKVGLSFEQYVWDGQRERLISVEVIGEEKVLTDMGRFDAYKIKIEGVITGGIISRRTLKRPPENGYIWIAKDAYRTPLRAVTPTKLGQAEAVLSARSVNPE